MSSLDDIIARDSAPPMAPVTAPTSALDAIIARDAAPVAAPDVTTSRGPDGVLQINMVGQQPDPQTAPAATPSAPQSQQPPQAPDQNMAVNAIEGLGRGARGLYQGLTDLPAGIGQSSEHQGMQILGGVDSLLGTNLAQQAAPNVQSGDAQVAQREAAYQAATPGSIAAGVGRFAGNVAPAFIGGPSAAAAPIAQGVGLAAKAFPNSPLIARLLGTVGGSAAQAAAYGGSSPVMTTPMQPTQANPVGNDYNQQANHNALISALIGGAAPLAGSAVIGTGRIAGNVARGIVDPFTQAGQQRIAQGILARAVSPGPMSVNASQLVEGSAPTLAESTGNPGIATLQRTMRDLHPGPFVDQEQSNAGARLNAFNQAAGDHEALTAARADRAATAEDLYGKAIKNYTGELTPYIKGQITQLLKRPSIEDASKVAQKWAIERGERPTEIGSLQALHDVKTALDDKIGQAVQSGAGGEAKALGATKDKLLGVMDKMSPEYARARSTYAAMSRPINAMETLQGLKLTDQMGDITLQKVQTAIRSIQDRMAKPGVNPAKSLDAKHLATLHAIRDDLLRSKNVLLGKSAGSNTAQNLATQNLIGQSIPGRIGAMASKAPAGSIGALLGSGLGYAVGGPMGSAAGAAAGGSLGRTATGIMNMHNDAIQEHLIRLLLNQNGSGTAALNRIAAPGPTDQIRALAQRLLYPSITVGSGQTVNRPRLP